MTEEEMKKKLKKKLDADRYEHTIGVAYTAVSMAMKFGEDLNKTFLAGLLHDCAKCYPDEKKFALCEKYNIALSEYEIKIPALIHAKLGAYVAKDKYGVTDENILSAITWHTTGTEDMTVLEKIIYIADYIEPKRTKQKNLAEIRKMAFTDLDETMYLITRDILEYLSKDSGLLDPETEKTYQYYKTIHDKKESEN